MYKSWHDIRHAVSALSKDYLRTSYPEPVVTELYETYEKDLNISRKWLMFATARYFNSSLLLQSNNYETYLTDNDVITSSRRSKSHKFY